jgi:nucleotide-binding universal stress UspA family protein
MHDVILVATDGSEPAERAVDHAFELAAASDATVHVISVVDTKRYGEPALSSAELILDDFEDRAQSLLKDIAERAADADFELVTEQFHGEPHDEILSYADEVDADLLILGRHGRSRTGHHIGSVSDRVVDSSDRPVHLV